VQQTTKALLVLFVLLDTSILIALIVTLNIIYHQVLSANHVLMSMISAKHALLLQLALFAHWAIKFLLAIFVRLDIIILEVALFNVLNVQ
jgi:hypothetical protein